MKLISFVLFILFCIVSHAESVEDGRYIGVHSGYGISSSDLTGTGFNAKLPARGSVVYGGDLSYKAADASTLFNLKYDKTSFDMNAPAGVSPASISVYREDIRFMAIVSPWEDGSFENFTLGIGYGLLRTGATDTSTYNVLNKQTSQGLMLNVGYKFALRQDWILHSDLGLFLPHRLIEGPQITGMNGQQMGFEANLALNYAVSERFVAFIGATYRLDKATFDGSGSRGVTSGVDNRTYIAIPVGIKIGY